MFNKIRTKIHDHPSPYPLGWVKKDVDIRVMKQCKINFFVIFDYIYEVELEVVPLDVCGVGLLRGRVNQ